MKMGNTHSLSRDAAATHITMRQSCDDLRFRSHRPASIPRIQLTSAAG
jgi:hypothetical protein